MSVEPIPDTTEWGVPGTLRGPQTGPHLTGPDDPLLVVTAPSGRVRFRITRAGRMRGPLAWLLWAQMFAAGALGAGAVEAVRAIL